MNADLAANLRALAERVARNVPHRRDPERFHTEKSCICQDLERIADALDDRAAIGRPSNKIEVNRPRRTELSVTVIGGRRIAVQRTREPFFVGGR